MFFGFGVLILMVIVIFFWLFELVLFVFGLLVMDQVCIIWVVIFYLWGLILMFGIWFVRVVEFFFGGWFFVGLLFYICGYGLLFCVIIVDLYIKEWCCVDVFWIKIEKIGCVDL